MSQAPSSAPRSSESSSGRTPFRRRRPLLRKKVCRFCADRVNRVDWKALHILRSFVTDRGKILSSRTTGTCAKHQRQLTIGIKRARTMALLPFLVTG